MSGSQRGSLGGDRGGFTPRGRGNPGSSGRGNFGDRGRGNPGSSGRGNFGDRGRGNSGSSGRGNFGDRGRGNFGDRGRGNFGDRGRGGFADRGRGGFGDRPQPQQTGLSEVTQIPKGESLQIIKAPLLQPGVLGRSVDLIANFYKSTIKSMIVHHYDVEITSGKKLSDDVLALWLKRVTVPVLEYFIKNHDLVKNRLCFTDFKKNLYVVNQELDLLRYPRSELKVPVGGGTEIVFVNLKHAAKIDLGNMNNYYANKSKSVKNVEIQALNNLVNFTIRENFAPFGRAFFDQTDGVMPAASNPSYSFSRGFINSVRLTQSGLSLNIHLKTAILITPQYKTLLEFFQIKFGKPEQYNIRYINDTYKNLKIFTQHVEGKKHTFVAKKLIDKTPYEKYINEYNHKEGTIAQYFLKKYGLKLQKFPLIQCSKKNSFIPLELCYLKENQFISNQNADMSLSQNQLRYATISPQNYFSLTGKYVNKISSSKTLKDFGVSISSSPMQFGGRVLPKVDMKSGVRGTLYGTEMIRSWIGLNLVPQLENEFQNFVKQFEQACKAKGLMLPGYKNAQALNLNVSFNSQAKLEKLFESIATQHNPDFILVTIPSRRTDNLEPGDVYKLVKHLCDQRYGIPTQCVKSDNIRRLPRGYPENLLLKVNGKLGGRNRIMDLRNLNKNLQSDTMVVGMDVNHPGLGASIKASIAAAVGSYDSNYSKFSASIKVQTESKLEIITKADQMIKELLEQYKKNNGKHPKNVFIFRDGVSEGQFEAIKQEEIKLVKGVLGNSIKLIYVVVQKRHHTRFVLVTPERFGKNESHNVPAGTVVDKSIVEPDEEVFYLNSHFSPLGTSKPSKYIILKNELNLKTDEIQTFCNNNCQTCTRTEKSVSLPVPVKYADLCAYRAKAHLDIREAYAIHSEVSKDVRISDFISEYNRKVKISPSLQNRLYYC